MRLAADLYNYCTCPTSHPPSVKLLALFSPNLASLAEAQPRSIHPSFLRLYPQLTHSPSATMPPRPTTPPGKSSAFSFGNEWSWSLDAITPPPTSERSKGTSLSASSHGQSPTLNAGHSGSALFRFGQSSSPLLPSFKFDPAQKPDSQAASTKSSSVQSPPVFSSLFGSPNSDVGSAAPSVPSTPQRGHKATLPVCQFGDETGFSFRGLHNASPMPSPKPQPQHETPTQWSPPPLALSSPKPNQNHDLASPVGLKPANVLHSSVGTSSAPATRSDDTDDSKPLPPTKTVQAVSGAAGVSPDVIPYDVRDEQAPPHRFFTNEFQRTLQAGIEVAKKTTEILDQPRRLMNDSALDKLHDDAKKLRVFHGSDTRTIAVLGDSGEGEISNFKETVSGLTYLGKSSLINSLLHFPGIAKTVIPLPTFEMQVLIMFLRAISVQLVLQSSPNTDRRRRIIQHPSQSRWSIFRQPELKKSCLNFFGVTDSFTCRWYSRTKRQQRTLKSMRGSLLKLGQRWKPLSSTTGSSTSDSSKTKPRERSKR